MRNVRRTGEDLLIEKTWENLYGDKERIGIAIKLARLLTHKSQTDVAREIGVDRSTISKWENGIHYPDKNHFVKLVKTFK